MTLTVTNIEKWMFANDRARVTMIGKSGDEDFNLYVTMPMDKATAVRLGDRFNVTILMEHQPIAEGEVTG